jgi:hypothetical protein
MPIGISAVDSAKNFLEATDGGTVITIDINQVPNMGVGHNTIIKSASDVTKEEIGERVGYWSV